MIDLAQTPAGLAEDMRRVLDLFADAPGGMIVTSGPDHRIEMMNAAYAAWIGRHDVIGRTLCEAFPHLVEHGFIERIDAVYATGVTEVIRGNRTTVRGAEGQPPREAYVNYVLQPMRAADGSVCGLFCQGQDVTKERLATEELRESREQLRDALEAAQAIFDNSHDLICTIDVNGCFQRVNRHAERILGYAPDEMVGRSYADFIHPDDRRLSEEITARIWAGVLTNTFTTRYIHKDGSEVPIMWRAVWSEPHESLFAIGRDMRDHVAAEEKLRQAQKMEAIGRLTGGIAHDFNNLLTVVIGAAETLADSLGDQTELGSVAQMALEAAERGAELISQLMAVSRTQPLAPQTVNGGKVLEGLLPILSRTLSRDIKVRVEAEADDLYCLADLTQLTSAMLNLSINARDAMPSGGDLVLRAMREPGRGKAGCVMLSVEDTGEGMSSQTRARALEPFFTTKPEGRGSGLGLSMVYGFAAQSGGRLEIDSEPGRGTCVSVCLPQAPPAEAVLAKPVVPSSSLPSGLRVVLVEDDDMVRAEVLRQLAALGCEVSAHANAYDALDALALGGAVDVLMTDINMPGGLNGRQLADHARLFDPELRILFTSGHTDDPVLRSTGQDPRAAFLAKPYRRSELARKLAEVLPQAA